MNEIWKEISGLEGLYEISNLGNIRAMERSMPYNKHKNFFMTKKGKILKIGKNRKGYAQTRLRKDGEYLNVKIHRLVANAFIPNPKNKPQVNHKDGNKANNAIENLEWVTNQENTDHAVRSGYKQKKLNEYQVRVIRQLGSDMRQPIIAELFGICQQTVSEIITRKIWKHI